MIIFFCSLNSLNSVPLINKSTLTHDPKYQIILSKSKPCLVDNLFDWLDKREIKYTALNMCICLSQSRVLVFISHLLLIIFTVSFFLVDSVFFASLILLFVVS